MGVSGHGCEYIAADMEVEGSKRAVCELAGYCEEGKNESPSSLIVVALAYGYSIPLFPTMMLAALSASS